MRKAALICLFCISVGAPVASAQNAGANFPPPPGPDARKTHCVFPSPPFSEEPKEKYIASLSQSERNWIDSVTRIINERRLVSKNDFSSTSYLFVVNVDGRLSSIEALRYDKKDANKVTPAISFIEKLSPLPPVGTGLKKFVCLKFEKYPLLDIRLGYQP